MKKNLSRFQMGNAIIWAAVMIATALVMAGSDVDDKTASYLLLLVLIPAWLVSDMMIKRSFGGRRRQ